MNRRHKPAFICLSGVNAREPTPPINLTPKERETLQWVMMGKTAWEISRIQGRSEATVNFHLCNIRRKFGVTTMRAVMLKAIEHRTLLLQ